MAFLSTCHFRATKNLYSKSLLHMKATRTSGHLQHLDVQLFNRQIKKRTAAFWVTHYHHIPLYLISMPNCVCTANGYFTLGSNASFIMHNIYCFSVSFVFLFACLHFIVLLEPAVNLCLCSLRCFFFSVVSLLFASFLCSLVSSNRWNFAVCPCNIRATERMIIYNHYVCGLVFACYKFKRLWL